MVYHDSCLHNIFLQKRRPAKADPGSHMSKKRKLLCPLLKEVLGFRDEMERMQTKKGVKESVKIVN